jgi:hypothetical protein
MRLCTISCFLTKNPKKRIKEELTIISQFFSVVKDQPDVRDSRATRASAARTPVLYWKMRESTNPAFYQKVSPIYSIHKRTVVKKKFNYSTGMLSFSQENNRGESKRRDLAGLSFSE